MGQNPRSKWEFTVRFPKSAERSSVLTDIFLLSGSQILIPALDALFALSETVTTKKDVLSILSKTFRKKEKGNPFLPLSTLFVRTLD